MERFVHTGGGAWEGSWQRRGLRLSQLSIDYSDTTVCTLPYTNHNRLPTPASWRRWPLAFEWNLGNWGRRTGKMFQEEKSGTKAWKQKAPPPLGRKEGSFLAGGSAGRAGEQPGKGWTRPACRRTRREALPAAGVPNKGAQWGLPAGLWAPQEAAPSIQDASRPLP